MYTRLCKQQQIHLASYSCRKEIDMHDRFFAHELLGVLSICHLTILVKRACAVTLIVSARKVLKDIFGC